jgi:murein DD-endopeptidase MepM/ murein hydrolase activator NlpD
MPRSYRLLSLSLLLLLGVTLAAALRQRRQAQPAPPPLLLAQAYARPLERVHQERLTGSETVAGLLRRLRLQGDQAQAILDQLSDSTAAGRLRAGRALELRLSTRTGGVRSLQLELDADRVLRVDGRRGPVRARVDSVQVRTDTAVFSGQVRYSLYEALLNGKGEVPRGERERIADQIADQIFATRIDFTRDLQRGDRYQVLYERVVRPDGSARRARLLAVRFLLSGRMHEAYLYRHEGSDGWYDGKGESLKRGFLRAPLEFRAISSGFSRGRYHPILHLVRAHAGIDYAAAPGTPVRAVADGVVRRAGWSGGYGNLLELAHARGYSTRYGHLRAFARGIHPGSRVRQGEVVAYVGMTGLATGPHLHYEFRSQGLPLNPASVKEIAGEPVESGRDSRFRRTVQQRVAALERGAGEHLAAREEGHPGGGG